MFLLATRGVSMFRNWPSPDRASFGRSASPAAFGACARRVRTWGPVTNPATHALVICHCALLGQNKGAQGRLGGASCLGHGWLRLTTHPPPPAHPSGGQLESTAHWLWVQRAGVGAQHWLLGSHGLSDIAQSGSCRRLARGGGQFLPPGGVSQFRHSPGPLRFVSRPRQQD